MSGEGRAEALARLMKSFDLERARYAKMTKERNHRSRVESAVFLFSSHLHLHLQTSLPHSLTASIFIFIFTFNCQLSILTFRRLQNLLVNLTSNRPYLRSSFALCCKTIPNMGRIRLQICVLPWEQPTLSSSSTQPRQETLKWCEPCSENTPMQEVCDRIIDSWKRMFKSSEG